MPYIVPLYQLSNYAEGINLLTRKLRNCLISCAYISPLIVVTEQNLTSRVQSLMQLKRNVRDNYYQEDNSSRASLWITIPRRSDENNVVIIHPQSKYWRVELFLVNSDTKNTCRYQGNTTFYLDNVFASGRAYHHRVIGISDHEYSDRSRNANFFSGKITYLNDKQKTTCWIIELNHRHYFNSITLDVGDSNKKERVFLEQKKHQKSMVDMPICYPTFLM